MVAPTKSRFRRFLWTAAGLCAIFAGIQFARPALPSGPVTAEIQAPDQVREILRNSCYSCHSNQPKLAWFDEVVPAYWLVDKDVRQARERVNFSELGSLSPAAQKSALYEAVNQIQMGAMPLPSYVRLHPGAAIAPQQLAVLRAYLEPPGVSPILPPADTRAADAEYQSWLKNSAAASSPHPAPNGIAFLPGYKDWKTISSSDRSDNDSIREVLGNDVAIKAIADNRINPWPDGTAFAKVAWVKQRDANGIAHAGKFLQVEFMIRDSTKYAATKNWGFARWRGTELKPYGAGPAFASECVGCHAPLRKNDYVFTLPIRGQQ